MSEQSLLAGEVLEDKAYWFAVKTKPRQEQVACDNLHRQEFNAYLPKIQLRKRRRQQWVQVVEPLFPGYLFIQVNPFQQSLSPVRSTIGVSHMIRFGFLLKPVPDEVIHYLRSRDNEGEGHHLMTPEAIKKGDKVEILEGPFHGLTAAFQMQRAEDRVLLLLDLLGRKTTVCLHPDHIQKIS